MSLLFHSEDGTIWRLDGTDGVRVVGRAEGLFNIPVDLIVDQRVAGDGAVLVNSRRAPRRVVLDFMLDDDGGSLTTLWATFIASIAAGGKLVYIGANGTRELRNVVLEAPDRSMTGQDLEFHGTDVFSISFLALDPWWYDSNVQYASGMFNAPTVWNPNLSWSPNLPWNGGASISIVNPGDTSCPVAVVVSGAASSMVFSNNGVGWTLASTLGSGSYVTVDGRPGSRGPRSGSSGLVSSAPSGNIDWSLLSEGSQLFELQQGSNSVVFGASGTDFASRWWIFFTPRYLTP